MKTLLKSPKNTFLIIFDRSGHFRPIPATNQIGKIKKIIKKSPKMRFFKNPYFVISRMYLNGGGFPGSKGPISGRLSYFRPLYNKIWIFEKSHFWRFFWWFSWFCKSDSWPGSAGSGRTDEILSKMCSWDSLEVFSYL